MTEQIKPLRIFLIYTRADVAPARDLYEYLRRKGFEVWFDEQDLVPGQNWQLEIVKELNQADVIIICFSQSIVSKDGQVQKEFRYALDQMLNIPKERTYLIPVRFQPCGKPSQLSQYTWADLFEQGGRENLIRGLRRRASELGRAPIAETDPQKKTLPNELQGASTNMDGNATGNIVLQGNHNVIQNQTFINVDETYKAQLEQQAREKYEREEAQRKEIARQDELARQQREKEEAEKKAQETARLNEFARQQREKEETEKKAQETALLNELALKQREKEETERKAKESATAQTKEWIKRMGWGLLLIILLFAIFKLAPAMLPPALTPTVEASATQTPAATFTQTSTATLPPVATATTTLTSLPVAKSQTPTPTVANVKISPKDNMPLHLVPAGPFTMGNNSAGLSEKPAHLVTLDAFWIDETEITNRQYALCVADGACKLPYNLTSVTRPKYYDNPDFADYPVTHVFWKDAKNYCIWAGRTLPSEAQWEKAARGGADNEHIYPWGDDAPTANLLNYYNTLRDTSKVGAYPTGASPYGALDMAGNVWEWVNDYFDSTYYSTSPATNPTGPAFGDAFSLRGGSWSSTKTSVRSFYRANGSSGYINVDVGFRCALVP